MDCKTLTTDVVCTACKYNLRGVNAYGNCPECGTPVMESLSQFAAQSLAARMKYRWTKRLAISFAVLHLCVAGALLVLLARGAGDAAIMLMILDFPLWFFWSAVGGPAIAGASNNVVLQYLLYCASVGTVMYGLAGALIGLAVDWLRKNAPDLLQL